MRANKQAAGFQDVQRVEEPPVEIAEAQTDPADQKGQFENRMPSSDQVEHDGDGKEFPWEVLGKPDHIERSQESQEFLVVAGLRES